MALIGQKPEDGDRIPQCLFFRGHHTPGKFDGTITSTPGEKRRNQILFPGEHLSIEPQSGEGHPG